jgi:peptidyl-prolyl cis-trans isomerase C
MRRTARWAILLAICAVAPLAADTGVSPVVMTVNDQPVYLWELGLLVPQIQMEIIKRGMKPTREEISKVAMQKMLDTRLLAQEARRRNLAPDKTRIDETLAQIEEQAGGPEELEAALAKLGATDAQLRAHTVETELVRLFVETEIEPRVTVTAAEVSTYYDENPEQFERPDMVRARHILVRITPNSTPDEKKAARARATSAHKRVLAGEDFATVASEVSEGREAANGGDMGFFARDSMMPELTDVAFSLDVGEISDIIETRFGFHILKVEEKRPASKTTFSEAKGPVRQLIKENKTKRRVDELLLELRKNAAVVLNTPQTGASAAVDGG